MTITEVKIRIMERYLLIIKPFVLYVIYNVPEQYKLIPKVKQYCDFMEQSYKEIEEERELRKSNVRK